MKRLQEIENTLAGYPSFVTMKQVESCQLQYRRESVLEEMEEYQKISLELGSERAELEKMLETIETRPLQHIRLKDTAAALKSLGMKPSKREVQEMVWEVNDNLDGVIDWDMFRDAFVRKIQDKSGLEPGYFHHLVQFLIYDRDNKGRVSIDDMMNLLYARVGREGMDSMIAKLFGGQDDNSVIEVGVHGDEVDFRRYWEVLSNEQRGMAAANKKGKRSR
mmetsp:Transcript_31146/g.65123  ORF Transcript_31146/g.65123 Transcript_31146/m.65123 type:complete len:220 (+) Transcript_31146:1-660(+)